MRKVHVWAVIILSTFLVACGGGGGNNGGNLSDEVDVIDTFILAQENLEGVYSVYGAGSQSASNDYRINGCYEYGVVDRAEILDVLYEQQDTYFCYDFDQEPYCIYPTARSYRDSYQGESPNYDNVAIDIGSHGVVEFEAISNSSAYDYSLVVGQMDSCDPNSDEAYAEPQFSPEDINNNWVTKVYRVNSTGVPVLEKSGGLSCLDDVCFGIVDVTNGSYDDLTQSWSGLLEYQGNQFEALAVLSPAKNYGAIVGCPFGIDVENFVVSCLMITLE
ncbi:hypothetical protein [Zhongshania aliphaticivorans]|uniref:hypothetical protein n=1 Tax=Zhongshania aliphaticivorans TaxID=1470434 RepID=UPI0012E6B9E0|nr:hypothetical protein [Zhongshania aliphaticivorans]CAA0083001.1 Uncharacterised protein [Zhongshania aliphaticivorans]